MYQRVLRLATPVALALFAAFGCGGSDVKTPTDPTPPPSTPPPAIQPANITVVSAQQANGPGFGVERVTVHLHNTGGPGAFTVEGWGLAPNVVNGDPISFGRTEAVEVAADYDETVSWDFTTGEPPDFFYIRYLLVFSRDQGSAQYRQTDHHDFPL